MSVDSGKPTRGPWEVWEDDDRSNSGSDLPLIPVMAPTANGGYRPIAEVAADMNDEDEFVISEEDRANAALIAEAGTVLHETGKTPLQLADENARLTTQLLSSDPMESSPAMKSLTKDLAVTKRELADYRNAAAEHLTARSERTAERDKLAEECARLRSDKRELLRLFRQATAGLIHSPLRSYCTERAAEFDEALAEAEQGGNHAAGGK